MARPGNVSALSSLRFKRGLLAHTRFGSTLTVRARANPSNQLFRTSYPSYSRNASSTTDEGGLAAEQEGSTKKGSRRSPGKYVLITALTLGIGFGFIYVTDTRASVHRWIIPPAIRWLYPDAEDAHHAGVDALRTLYQFGLHPRERGNPDGDGKFVTQAFGYTLSNPIGISAGLDKDAEIPSPLFELGPAIVEVGGTTPLPQPGNPRSRVFRLPSQCAFINRYGLNSQGADHMASLLRERLEQFAYAHGFGWGEHAQQRVLNGEAGVPAGSLIDGKLLAVQVAKNKATPDGDIEATKRDYVYCVDHLGKYADILVVNVSSPNTVGLRNLQKVGPLKTILKGVVQAAKRTDRKTKPVVMVKVSPDEDSDEQISGICDAVRDSGVDGVIVANTTNRRPEAIPRDYVLPAQEQATLREKGGFSGPHLLNGTVALVKRYRELLDRSGPPQALSAGGKQEHSASTTGSESLPSTDTGTGPTPPTESGESGPKKVIFASGGITNGQAALDVLNAGASVAMLYTGLVYGGSGTITRVKEEMRDKV